jgi:hypothetical protein
MTSTFDKAAPDYVAVLTLPVVTLGDIWWNTTDQAGVDWICENLAGWSGLPATDVAMLGRTFDHGAWSGPGWYAARDLELTGSLVASDRPTLLASLDVIAGQLAAATSGTVPLAVTDEWGTRTLEVRSAGAVETSFIAQGAARVVIPLAAPWPIKLGPPQQAHAAGYVAGQGRAYPRPDQWGFRGYGPSGTSGDLHLVLGGTAPVRPRFTFYGPSLNPQVIAPGQGLHLDFRIELAAADVLVADADTRAVVLNIAANRRFVLSNDSAWFDLLPGVDNLIQYRPDDQGGAVVVDFAEGWW